MSKVHKAVIAAAGRGTRFLPAVKSYPKELVPVLDKPNLQLLIEELIGAGITEIAIVHRCKEPSIKKYFTPDSDWENYLKTVNKLQYLDSLKFIWNKVKKLEFIFQPSNLPYGSASPALAAKKFIGKDPFVYMFGDDLIVEPQPGLFLSQMISTFEKSNPDAVIATQEVPRSEISRYGCIHYKTGSKNQNQIDAIMEKMSPDEAPSTKAILGRFVVSAKVLDFITHQDTSNKDNELWWTDSITYLAQTGIVLNQTIEHGQWMTTGDPLRWLKANIAVALNREDLATDLRQYIASLV